VLDDFGGVNIQRWWNRGIAEAARRGATVVAVANDDIQIAPGTLQELVKQLLRTGATIATPGRELRLYRSPWTVRRRLDGALWLLSLAEGLRPDNAYSWGYGDDELDLQARRRHNGVVTVPVDYFHVHHNRATDTDSFLVRLSRSDASTFRSRHPLTWVMRQPRDAVRRIRRRAWSSTKR
jgi:hypothetical protein